MRTRHLLPRCLLLVLALGLLSALPLSAQVSRVPPRITQAVNDTRLAALRGNTHPLARAEFDRGAAPADLPMERMMLLLKRSPEQEAALEKFMAEQLDPSSPNFHHWLSPEQFGELYGPSDQDVQAIEAWLASHGFAVNQVSKGRTTIEFSGTHAQVQDAFHTAIHKFVLPNGEEHWANAGDPAIPAALAPVVSGIHSLNNFFPKPMNHIRGPVARPVLTAEAKARPMFTFASSGPCSVLQDSPFFLLPPGIPSGQGECFMVTPADLAVIYNYASLWNANPAIDGTGQTIAIVGGSNINVQDVRNFRSLMGLPAKDPVIILAGANPGIQNSNGFESEALIDVEWAGAVAKNATLYLVIARDSLTMAGVDIAAQFIVDNNLAPVLSMSFGLCELGLGTSGNNFYNTLWQRAAAQGITVLVSSGDQGSAGCDFFDQNGPPSQPARNGLQVNGLASTPYNVAVGGTDFNDATNPLTYWNPDNGTPPTQASAMGYVPETVWNDTCTNFVFTPPTLVGYGATAEEVCNNSQVTPLGLVATLGGSGGVSNCTMPSGPNCSGGYAKPSWQTGTGVPNDGKRDLPDVSLFAGVGTISASFYYLCESDLAPCTFSGNFQVIGVGGTSVSAQVFAGVMALVNQKAGERQGNANSVFYALAANQSEYPANCNSGGPLASNCIFNDVTVGTNAMPCVAGPSPSPNCFAALITDPTGVLAVGAPPPLLQAYDAGPAYDLATGLGTINAFNLVSATQPGNPSGWATNSGSPDFTLTSSGVVSVSGNTGTLSITVNPQGGFSGAITLSCDRLPAGETCTFMPSSQPLVNGPTPITVTIKGAGAFVNPTNRPHDWRAPGSGVALFGALLTAILLLGMRGRSRRWSAALAVLALALIVGAVGCGGGSSGGGGGGGGTLAAGTGVVVATGSGVTHSIGFTIP